MQDHFVAEFIPKESGSHPSPDSILVVLEQLLGAHFEQLGQQIRTELNKKKKRKRIAVVI